MASIKDIMAYYCKNYPHKNELSKARLTKMVYLADWKSALRKNNQMSNINWIYNHYGPYVDDIVEVAQKENIFSLNSITNSQGGNKDVIYLKNDAYRPKISNAEKETLDHIISITKDMYWNKFIKLVYSTYPMLKSEKYDQLNLIVLAEKYKASINCS